MGVKKCCAEWKMPDPPPTYPLCNSISMKFYNWQDESNVCDWDQINGCFRGVGRESPGRGTGKLSMGWTYSVSSWGYSFVKPHGSLPLRPVHFTVCKWYLSKWNMWYSVCVYTHVCVCVYLFFALPLFHSCPKKIEDLGSRECSPRERKTAPRMATKEVLEWPRRRVAGSRGDVCKKIVAEMDDFMRELEDVPCGKLYQEVIKRCEKEN